MDKSEIISLIGKENWNDFKKWMNGKTVLGTEYFTWDVKKYMEKRRKKK